MQRLKILSQINTRHNKKELLALQKKGSGGGEASNALHTPKKSRLMQQHRVGRYAIYFHQKVSSKVVGGVSGVRGGTQRKYSRRQIEVLV